MCLSISIIRPHAVLEKGCFKGFEYEIIHNDIGSRCGYIKLLPNHPWYGKDYDYLDFVEVHGGLTFAEADVSCDGEGAEQGGLDGFRREPLLQEEDDGWWIGFDCAHSGDAKDPLLMSPEMRKLEEEFDRLLGSFWIKSQTIKTTNYVRQECESLIEQAICAS